MVITFSTFILSYFAKSLICKGSDGTACMFSLQRVYIY